MFYVTFGMLNKYWNPRTMSPSDSELQSSDSEIPDDLEDNAKSDASLGNGRLY